MNILAQTRIVSSLHRYVTAALSLASIAPAAAAGSAPARSPNFVFIIADDLGYGDIGCYGQTEIKTPHIDRLARQGVRFTQFYTGAPVCAPARNTLLTGEHAGHALLRANGKIDLRPQDTTIAEILHDAAYVNGMAGKWGLGKETGPGSPAACGFDHFFGYIDQTMAHNYYPTYLVRDQTRVPLRNVVPNPGPYDQGVATKKLDYSADLIGRDAVAFIEAHRDRPFALFFTPTLPHANDEATPNGMEVPDYGPYADRPWPDTEKGFAAMVTRLDDEVGMILAKLEALHLEDETVVIFTSDNGPHDEGGHDRNRFHSSGGFRGMKRDLYEGGIRVPLIVRWPGHTKAGTTSDYIGYFPDFMPTFAELAGVRTPVRDGISFVRAIEGRPGQTVHPYLYWEFYERATAQAVRMGRWKVIRSPIATGKVEVYDLERDPAESHDVAASHPDVIRQAIGYMQDAHVPSPLWNVPPATAR